MKKSISLFSMMPLLLCGCLFTQSIKNGNFFEPAGTDVFILNDIKTDTMSSFSMDMNEIKNSVVMICEQFDIHLTEKTGHSSDGAVFMDVYISENQYMKKFTTFNSVTISFSFYKKDSSGQLYLIGKTVYTEDTRETISSFKYFCRILTKTVEYTAEMLFN